jgi:hypothetical protein
MTILLLLFLLDSSDQATRPAKHMAKMAKIGLAGRHRPVGHETVCSGGGVSNAIATFPTRRRGKPRRYGGAFRVWIFQVVTRPCVAASACGAVSFVTAFPPNSRNAFVATVAGE